MLEGGSFQARWRGCRDVLGVPQQLPPGEPALRRGDSGSGSRARAAGMRGNPSSGLNHAGGKSWATAGLRHGSRVI